MFRRIWDAVLILFCGKCAYEVRFSRMEQELMDLIITVSDSLEKLNAWAARMAKRQKRDLQTLALLDEAPEVEPGGTNAGGRRGRGGHKFTRLAGKARAAGVAPGMTPDANQEVDVDAENTA